MKTYIINSKEQFDKHFQELKSSAKVGSTPDVYLVGFDTEFISRANFPDSFSKATSWIKNTSSETACCLIQLATYEVCMVVNLVNLKNCIPRNLFKIVSDECWIKVGVGVELDLKNLSQNYDLGHCSGGIEIRNLALMARYKKPNLEYMFNQFVGGHIKKNGSICDWSQPLTESQLVYAARDAIMSHRLFVAISKPSIDFMVDTEQNSSASSVLDIQFENIVQNVVPNKSSPNSVNYIGRLNELAQKDGISLPTYNSVEISKSPPLFRFICDFGTYQKSGVGNSKKVAKQNAAKKMYNYYCKNK